MASERAKIREELRAKIARGSFSAQRRSANAQEASFSEDQLVDQLKRLQPRSKGGLIYQKYDNFQFYWRHPALRLLFVMVLWLLDMYIFGEDPTTYSKTPCRIGGIGHIVNVFFPTSEDTVPWILLRIILVTTFLLGGVFFAKILKSRLALRFEMFTYKGSYFIITAAVLVIDLVLCAKVYNWIRWKVLCNSYAAPCACEDVKCGGYISNDLHIRNDTFAHLTQCGAFIADTLAVFSVLDLILQDDSVYRLGSGLNISGFWERHRTHLLWGSFSVVMLLGVPSIFLSHKALATYQQGNSVTHRSNVGRMVVAGCLFVVDLCIVTQDLDFPHFENSLEVMLLGTNIAFEGSFINYIMVFVSMLLDLNCLYTHGWYRPSDYGQYYVTDRRLCNLKNTSMYRQVDCSSERCPWIRLDPKLWNNRTECEDPKLLLGSRYHPEIVKYRYYLAIVPILTGIIIFCSLFRLAGRSPQNLCRRVVISNAFAAKKIEEYESRSIEMTEVTGRSAPSVPSAPSAEPGASTASMSSTASASRNHLLAKLEPDTGGAGGSEAPRIIVVTASGVTAFELRDNPRSPYGGVQLAWMRPHVFCKSLRFWIMRKFAEWQGSSLDVHPSSRDYLYARVQDLKEKLRTENLVRTDVPFHSLELLWHGRLLHNETMLRSLGADAIVYLLYDRWSLRRKRLAAWRAEVFQ